MSDEERARLATATAAAQARPSVVVTVEMSPDGQLKTTSTAKSPIVTLGLLQLGITAISREAAGAPSPIVTAHGLPNAVNRT